METTSTQSVYPDRENFCRKGVSPFHTAMTSRPTTDMCFRHHHCSRGGVASERWLSSLFHQSLLLRVAGLWKVDLTPACGIHSSVPFNGLLHYSKSRSDRLAKYQQLHRRPVYIDDRPSYTTYQIAERLISRLMAEGTSFVLNPWATRRLRCSSTCCSSDIERDI